MGASRRVLVLNHNAVPPDRGGLTRTADLFRGLHSWSHLILNASTTEGARREYPSRFGFRSIWASPYRANGYSRVLNWTTFTAGALLEGLRQERVDLVYASSPHPLVGPAAVTLGKRLDVPVVFEVRDLWPEVLESMGAAHKSRLEYRVLQQMVDSTYASADAVVVLAEGVQHHLRRRFPRLRMELIPNSVEQQELLPYEQRRRVRHRMGLRGPIAIYAGAHGPANGLDRVLDAATRLRDTSWTFLLIGDGLEKSRLMKRADSESLANVVFMDPVPKSEIYGLLQAADVGLHILADADLFHFGVSPNKLLDYWAVGIPVLTNVSGATGALVTEVGGGVAVDHHGLAQGLQQLADAGPEHCGEMGQRGREWVRTHRSRDEMTRRLQSLLDSLV